LLSHGLSLQDSRKSTTNKKPWGPEVTPNAVSSAPLFCLDDLETAFAWIVDIREDYSANSDIWRVRRDWEEIKYSFLAELNNGSYEFGVLDRYEIDGALISLWSSQDMIALKLITLALQDRMQKHLPTTCYHVKGHGGLKKAVEHTATALPTYRFVMRSDIEGYYDSVNFGILRWIIDRYVHHPVLLRLISKACHRTETRGGIFYEYAEKGIPMGSPLSPLLGAIALIPLDLAMGKIQGIHYARFMDDWVVLTKSKTALRKVVKITHGVLNALKFHLHPTKTYIGKISHGFNFLGYYMDDQKILPSQETIRRFHERSTMLYEHSHLTRRYKKNIPDRDISEYQANEAAPTNENFQEIYTALQAMALIKPDICAKLQRYLGQWARWLKLGLSAIAGFESDVQTQLPLLFSCWSKGAYPLGVC